MSQNISKEAREKLVKLQMLRAGRLLYTPEHSQDYEGIMTCLSLFENITADYRAEIINEFDYDDELKELHAAALRYYAEIIFKKLRGEI